ncbi:HAMP domain-containing sensor histidine kinase [Gottfriedia acidiceleris]|uniref:sensor histidine kinase n=1 Tax=Gottfriedia acidiceleris TaxID=371036 RepID=UPI003394AC57
MSWKSRISKWLRSYRLKTKITATTVIGVILLSIPLHIWFVYLDVMQRGEDAYNSMVYHAVEVENAIRERGSVHRLEDGLFFQGISSRDERIIIYEEKSHYNYYFKSKEPPAKTSEFYKKTTSFILKILYKAYKEDIDKLGNFRLFTDKNGYSYASNSYIFSYNLSHYTVVITKNVTSVVSKPLARYQETFILFVIYYIFFGAILTTIGLNKIFGILGKAIDRSFVALKESDYNSRLLVTGEYGEEISNVKHKINEILERMSGIVKANVESMQDVSHEVGNKLTAISQSVGVLHIFGTNNKELVDTTLASIEENVSSITNVMRAILELAKIEQGFYVASYEAQVIKDLIETYLKHQRNLHPDFTLTSFYDSTNPILRINPEHFILILNPLIENAIRYSTYKKEVLVEVEDEVCPFNLYISISNWGQKIEEEEIQHIFNRYYRGKKQESTTKGSGLGLTICKKVVEIYKGEIQVKSDDTGKTTFTLVMPKTGKELKSDEE